MLHQRSRLGQRPAWFWLAVLLLLSLVRQASATQQQQQQTAYLVGSTKQTQDPYEQQQTAYLVGSMQQTHDPSNSSFNSLWAILSSPHPYSTIVLWEDYALHSQQPPVRLSHDLLITSAPGEFYQLSFAFLTNGVLMNNFTVTLRDIVIDQARKPSGQSVPFFAGEGVLRMQDAVRQRIACSPVRNATIATLKSTPRPPGFPGTQQASLVDFKHRGRLYPGSVWVQDVVVFVSPGDVEDAAYYAGYPVVQINVTRVCDHYVAANCQEQCLVQAVDDILAARASGEASKQQQLLAVLVPAIVVPTVVLLLAGLGAYLWRRRTKAAREAALLQQQQAAAQDKLRAQMEEGSGGRDLGPDGSARSHGYGSRSKQPVTPHRPGKAAGLLGGPLDMGAVGAIEEVTVGPITDTSMRRGWQLMACHTAPEFPEASANDAISLGVLLGAGSFGRVYRGRWRGLDVAVKVLHHDAQTAASVANEVDLVMSFRHQNITTAFHFLTWNYAHDTGEGNASGSNAARSSPDLAAAAGAAGIAAAAAAAAGAGSGSAAAPGTPHRDPQAALRRGVDCTGGGDEVTSAGSGTMHTTGLAVIHSQSEGATNSSSQKVSSTAGGSGAHAGAPSHLQSAGVMPAVPAAAAAAAAGESAALGALQEAQSGPCSTGSVERPASVSKGHGRLGLEPVPSSPSWPLLQHLDSPQGTHSATAVAPGVRPASAAAVNSSSVPGSYPPGGSNAAAAIDPAGAAAGPLSPDRTSGHSGWNHDRLMPVWGTGMVSSGQVVPSWSHGGAPAAAALGTDSRSYGGVYPSGEADNAAVQDQQQAPQGQAAIGSAAAHQQPEPQQPVQQEFVPMVPVNMVPPSSRGLGQQGHQQQLQRYVPLVAAQQPRGDGSGTSSPSTQLSNNGQHFSGQLRQQQLTRTAGRFDTGSGGSSYIGGGKARSGEAQTWLILEYCDGGTLLDLMQEGMLHSPDTGEPNLAHVLTLLADVAAGMNYLHLRNCVHGDLKPANVLLRKQQGAPFGHCAKVSDFGLSKSLTAGQSHRSTRTLGTFNRAPPELLRLGRLSPSCDVYAFGVMVWELFTGQVAFAGLHYGEVFERVVLRQERMPVPPDMPQALASLMVSCWADSPMARPTFRMIQQSLSDMLTRLPDSGDRFVSDL